ncbi:MAG: phage tail assembly chaperone [Pseudomonadota bacterium]
MSWPFQSWHKIAIQRFGLSPSEFWAMPLADWLALLEPTSPALDRQSLTNLMKDYPDEEY